MKSYDTQFQLSLERKITQCCFHNETFEESKFSPVLSTVNQSIDFQKKGEIVNDVQLNMIAFSESHSLYWSFIVEITKKKTDNYFSIHKFTLKSQMNYNGNEFHR